MLFAGSGCVQSMLERQVIEDFTAALEEENEPALRRIASARFEEKAMRSDDALRDLEILELPEGKITVESVEEVEDDHRRVIVSDEGGAKYRFELLMEPGKQRWAVDDVLVRQKKKWKRVNAVVTNSTTQVMDLIFTIREFLDIWKTGSRDQILEMASPGLTASLQDVPDTWLKSISGEIAGRYESGMARRPEAQMHEQDAVVKLPVRGGHLLVSVTNEEGRWLVDDIEIHRRSDSGHPGSVRRQADAVASLARFLRAYENRDQEGLEKTATSEFYSETLQFTDLSLVQLPSPDCVPEQLLIRSFAGNVTVIVPTAQEMVRFDLVESQNSEGVVPGRTAVFRKFEVTDVTLYDRHRNNERTLAAVFTAPARATLFVKALTTHDIALLRQLSSKAMRESIWNEIHPEIIPKLTVPLSDFTSLTLADSSVQGHRTELKFRTGSDKEVRCSLLDENGSLKVDDLQYPDSAGQILSLKTQLALQIPVIKFARAWQQQDEKQLQAASSTGFNRLALRHFSTTPPDPARFADRLDTPVLESRVTQERATLTVGLTEKTSADVSLVLEHSCWLVDDVHFPQTDGTTIALRQSLRYDVADSMLSAAPRQPAVPQATSRSDILRASAVARPTIRSETASLQVGTPLTGRLVAGTSDVPGRPEHRVQPTHSLQAPASGGPETTLRQAPFEADAAEDSPGQKVPSEGDSHALDEIPDDDRYLYFGPGFGDASGPSPRSATQPKPDLADRPIPID